MTRQERLEYCKICQKQRFDTKKGIVCSLTNEHATFEQECPDFMLDEGIKALEAYKREMSSAIQKQYEIKAKPIVRIEVVREAEAFVREDWYLLLGFGLLATFINRLILYANFDYQYERMHIYLYLVIMAITAIAVLVRKSKQSRTWFFSDIKYKLMLAGIITVLNLAYYIIVLGNTGYLIYYGISFLIMSAFFSVLSSILIIPASIIIQKFKHA